MSIRRITPSSLLLSGIFLLWAPWASAVVPTPMLPIPPAPALPDVASYVLMDYQTGQIIAAKSEHLRRAPASLTKLMTAYLTYQALQGGTLHSGEAIPVSNAAWKAGGSSMFIQPGLPVTVDQLLHGLLIDSGNDAAVALAEAVAGSQGGFVTLMNDTALRLGLRSTHYTNVDGLPDGGLYTTALDVARLSQALVAQFPQILQITREKSYTYNGITQRSWNPVLFRDPTVDGLKTGLTDASGHCIDATALRSGRRLIAVEMGAPSWSAGTSAIEDMLNYGYRFFHDRTLYAAGQKVGTIHHASLSPMNIPVGVEAPVTVTVPRGRSGEIQTHLEIADLRAPMAKGTVIGQMSILLDGRVQETVPVVNLVPVHPAGFLTRLWHRISATI